YLLMTRSPPTSPLFPYTTLFRSTGSAMRMFDVRKTPGAARPVMDEARGATSLIETRSPGATFLVTHRVIAQWPFAVARTWIVERSEEHTSELPSLTNLVCRLLLS